jgi:hypothetical protein
MTLAEAWQLCQWFFELVGMLVIGGFALCFAVCVIEDMRRYKFPRRGAHPSCFRDWHRPTRR